MFSYLKRRREKQERMAEARKLGEAVGGQLRAELDIYIEIVIKPRRAAYLDVLRGQLATIDERLRDSNGEVSRVELAGIDYRIMLNNWKERRKEQLDHAIQSLHKEFEIAEAAGMGAEFATTVTKALDDQALVLMSDGLEVVMEIIPETTADHDDTLGT